MTCILSSKTEAREVCYGAHRAGAKNGLKYLEIGTERLEKELFLPEKPKELCLGNKHHTSITRSTAHPITKTRDFACPLKDANGPMHRDGTKGQRTDTRKSCRKYLELVKYIEKKNTRFDYVVHNVAFIGSLVSSLKHLPSYS